MILVPPEKTMTHEQIERRVRLAQTLMGTLQKVTFASRRIRGRELLLETQAGTVRVLAYGADDPRTLPLFVNIHGGGFVLGGPEMDDPFLARVVQETGVKTLSIDYALAQDAWRPTTPARGRFAGYLASDGAAASSSPPHVYPGVA